VRQPLEQMGRTAARMLLEIIGNAARPAARVELPTELIVRASTRPPKDGTS
jgi:DNA-binding LacI/PurR family transcriptional regulator